MPEFGPRMGLGLNHELKLNHEQKLALETLLKLRLELRHPEFPEARRGLDGMLTANEILKQRQATRILIGGVAEELWKKKRNNVEALDAHKDVDVMVLSKNFELEKDLEGGIDWWLPKVERLRVNSKVDPLGYVEMDIKWWNNTNNVVLSYGAEVNQQAELSHGLYIPNPEFMVNLRTAEGLTSIDSGRIQLQDPGAVVEKFEEKLRKSLEGNLPKEVKQAFAGQILDSRYEQDWRKWYDVLNVKGLEQGQVSAINSHLKNYA